MSVHDDIDAQVLLADAARLSHAAMAEAHKRMMAAGDAEAFERCGRAFQRECRNLRQTLALRDRLARETAAEAKAERAASAAALKERAATVRREAADQVRRILWTEYERPDWTGAVVGDIKTQLGELPDETVAEASPTVLARQLLAGIGLERPAGAAPLRRPSLSQAQTAAPADTS
jgi:hypothetical protein